MYNLSILFNLGTSLLTEKAGLMGCMVCDNYPALLLVVVFGGFQPGWLPQSITDRVYLFLCNKPFWSFY